MTTPNLAARSSPRAAIAVAFGVGVSLALAALVAPRSLDRPVATSALPMPAGETPDPNASNLVGIYRSSTCTLTLDAAGTYTISDCGDDFAKLRSGSHRYAIAGDEIVFRPSVLGLDRLAIMPRGRLVADDGTTFSITGGAR